MNGSDSPWTGQKEIDRTSFRRIGWRHVEQTTRTGAGSDGRSAGDSSSPPSRPDGTARGSRAWIRGERENGERVGRGGSERSRRTSSAKWRPVWSGGKMAQIGHFP